MPFLTPTVLAMLNLSGAKELLVQLMNELPSYMQTVAVVFRKASAIGCFLCMVRVILLLVLNLCWQIVIRLRLGTVGVLGLLRLLYGHRMPMHRGVSSFVALRREGICMWENDELLKLDVVNRGDMLSALLGKWFAGVALMWICYLLLRSRLRLEFLLPMGVRD